VEKKNVNLFLHELEKPLRMEPSNTSQTQIKNGWLDHWSTLLL